MCEDDTYDDGSDVMRLIDCEGFEILPWNFFHGCSGERIDGQTSHQAKDKTMIMICDDDDDDDVIPRFRITKIMLTVRQKIDTNLPSSNSPHLTSSSTRICVAADAGTSNTIIRTKAARTHTHHDSP